MPAAAKTTKASWKKSARHDGLMLPSGNKVSIVVPNLPELLRAGKVPNALVKYAQDTSEQLAGVSEDFSMEKVKEATDFLRWVVVTTVVDPADLEPDDVPDLPAEDVDTILSWAFRQTDIDAVGKQIAGLDKVPEWEKFRYERIGS